MKNFGFVLYAAVMVALIITTDILFLRHKLWIRLAVNAGIVLVFILAYFFILRKSR